MKKLVCMAAVVVLSAECFASNGIVTNSFYRRTGGHIVRPGSKQGSVVLVNASKDIAQKDVEIAAKYLCENTMLDFKALQDPNLHTGADALMATKANAVVLIVEDTTAPKILIAPDDRWAVINAAALKDGLPAGEALRKKMYAYRMRRVILRTSAQLLGGFQSMFQGNLMSLASSEDVDRVQEALPADTLGQMTDYLGKIGVRPEISVTYARAVKEGWAPAPTNDVQKAIWDRIHAIPDKPLKITYDKDKQKPVVK